MKTREIIMNAAFRLFEQHPFKEVTVQDILDESGVSRRTFYRYFRDKYELQEIYAVENSMFPFDQYHLPDHMDEAIWRELVSDVLAFMRDHRHFYLNASRKSIAPNSMWTSVRQIITELYYSIRAKHTQSETLSENDQITIRCFTSAIMALFEIYIFEKPELTIDQLLEICTKIIPEDFCTF